MEEKKNIKPALVALAMCGFAVWMALSGCGGGGTTQAARDGYLVVDMNVDGKDQLFRVDLQTGEKTQITNFAEGNAFCPTTTGYGEPIYFYRDSNSSATSGLAKINPDGTGYTYIGPINSAVFGMRIAKNGQKIAFYNISDQILTINPDGTGETVVYENSVDYVGGASISADGTKVYFNANPAGEMDPWVVNSDGTGATNILPGPGSYANNPKISPNGQKIAFARWDNATSTDGVWVMNADGTGQTKLGAFENVFIEGWSPDGQYIIAYDSGPNPGKIYAVKADGSAAPKMIFSDAIDNLGWIGDAVGKL